MSQHPLVSVIVPSYNSAHLVRDAVDSVLAQTYPATELIVVDDGSRDETRQVLARYGDRLQYVHQENRGLSGARNTGIAHARGELLAFLDADDKWHPDKLTRQVEALCANPRAAFAHVEVLYWDSETGLVEPRDKGRNEFAGNCYRRLFAGNRIIVSTALVRRDCLEKVGTFDEAIRRPSTQDYDLWLRLARHHEVVYVPEPLTYYRVHATNASKNAVMMLEDELYVVEKALREDPSIPQLFGRAAVRDRLFGIHSAIGFRNYERGNRVEARRAFARALRYRPTCLPVLKLWLATALPAPFVRGFRRLKQVCSI
jgi:glycosyltransferase involved in cell wall biosynthesis